MKNWELVLTGFALRIAGPLYLLAILVALEPAVAQGRGGKSGPAPVVAGKVVQLRLAGVESFVGTLRPIRQATVGSAVDGRVVEVLVAEGDAVGPDRDSENNLPFFGEPLVRLRTETLDIELETAEIQKQLLGQAVNELELSIPKDIELAETQVAGAEARLEYSKANFERSKSLSANNDAISEIELEQARSTYLADLQAVAGARASLNKLSTTREILLAQARTRLESAKQEILRLKDLKQKYTIRAPFAGFVTRKSTEVGAWIKKGDPIVEVVDLNPIEMVINVPQAFLQQIQQSLDQASDESPLSAEVVFEGVNRPVDGVVRGFIPQADLRSRNFPIRIELQNPTTRSGYLLQPGMLGRARLMIGVPEERTLVKKDALVLGGREITVFKVAAQGGKTVAVPVPVTTGAAVGDWIEISGQLNPGDTIVVVGNERLRPGQEIAVTRTVEELPTPPPTKDGPS